LPSTVAMPTSGYSLTSICPRCICPVSSATKRIKCVQDGAISDSCRGRANVRGFLRTGRGRSTDGVGTRNEPRFQLVGRTSSEDEGFDVRFDVLIIPIIDIVSNVPIKLGRHGQGDFAPMSRTICHHRRLNRRRLENSQFEIFDAFQHLGTFTQSLHVHAVGRLESISTIGSVSPLNQTLKTLLYFGDVHVKRHVADDNCSEFKRRISACNLTWIPGAEEHRLTSRDRKVIRFDEEYSPHCPFSEMRISCFVKKIQA
jgi:hypothetical protein